MAFQPFSMNVCLATAALVLKVRRKSLDVHPCLPESRSYFTRQCGALDDPKLKLFHLWHNLNRIYETRRLKEVKRDVNSFFGLL